MQKIITILLLGIATLSCSVIKKQTGSGVISANEYKKRNLYDVLKSGNLSEDNVYVQKASVTISENDEQEKFIITLKYLKSGEYLISVRNRTGIEAARIYISGDTILANDRINRKLISAAPDYLQKRYGISREALPILFGDFMGTGSEYMPYSDCINGLNHVSCLLKGMKLNYDLDCNMGKVVLVTRESSSESASADIRFSDFFEQENHKIPGKISISNSNEKSLIEIQIDKIELDWKGEIEFIPGNGYEKVELR